MFTQRCTCKNGLHYRLIVQFKSRNNESTLQERKISSFFGNLTQIRNLLTTDITKGKVNMYSMHCMLSLLPKFPPERSIISPVDKRLNFWLHNVIRIHTNNRHESTLKCSKNTPEKCVENCVKHCCVRLAHTDDFSGKQICKNGDQLNGENSRDLTFGEILSRRKNFDFSDEDHSSFYKDIPPCLFEYSKYPTFALPLHNKDNRINESFPAFGNLPYRFIRLEIPQKRSKRGIKKNKFIKRRRYSLVSYIQSEFYPALKQKQVSERSLTENKSSEVIQNNEPNIYRKVCSSEKHNVNLGEIKEKLNSLKVGEFTENMHPNDIKLGNPDPLLKYVNLFKPTGTSSTFEKNFLDSQNDSVTNSNKSSICEKPVERDQLPIDISKNSHSILNIINSVNRSGIIIHKDLYITNKILEELKKKKKETNHEKVRDKQAGPQHSNLLDLKLEDQKSFKQGVENTSELKNSCEKEMHVSSDPNGSNTFSPNAQYLDCQGVKNKKLFDVPGAKHDKNNGYPKKDAPNDPKQSNKTNEPSSIANIKSGIYPPSIVDSVVTNLRNPNSTIPLKKRTHCRRSHFSSNNETDCTVDVTTETSIISSKCGNQAKVQVHEVQTFKDKRLPVTFTTDTLMQIQGSTEKLRETTEIVEVAKAKLVLANSKADAGVKASLDHSVKLAELLSFLKHKLLMGSGSDVKKIPIQIDPVEKSAEPLVTNNSKVPEQKPIAQASTQKLIGSEPLINKNSKNLPEPKTVRSKNIKKSDFKKKVTKEVPVKTNGVHDHFKIVELSPEEVEKLIGMLPKHKRAPEKQEASKNPQGGKNPPNPPMQTVNINVNNKKKSRGSKKNNRKSAKEIIDIKPIVKNKEVVMGNIPKHSKPLEPKNKMAKSVFIKKDTNINKKMNETIKKSKPKLQSLKNEKTNVGQTSEPKLKSLKNDKKATVGKANQKVTNAAINKAEKQPLIPFSKDSILSGQSKAVTYEIIKITNDSKKEHLLDSSIKKTDSNMNLPDKNKDGKSPLKVSNSTFPDKIISSGQNAKKVVVNEQVVKLTTVKRESIKKDINTKEKLIKKDIGKELSKNLGLKTIQTNSNRSDNNIVKQPDKNVRGSGVNKYLNKVSFGSPYDTSIVKQTIPTPTIAIPIIPSYTLAIKPTTEKSSLSNQTAAIFDDITLDFDKITKETKIIPDVKNVKQTLVPLKNLLDFPLLNGTKTKYERPSDSIICVDCKKDPALRQKLKTIPSVTKVLNATMSDSSRFALSKWRSNMIAELGESGFQKFYREQIERGSEFHDKVQKHFSGSTQDLVNSSNLALRSISNISDLITDVSVVESHVVHSRLSYRGIVDCVARYRNKPVIIEWKRSGKKKNLLQNTFDAPLQLCAYLGALNYDSNYHTLQVEGGVVVVAYSDGTPADVFVIPINDCQKYWKQWLTRLKQYNMSDGETKLP